MIEAVDNFLQLLLYGAASVFMLLTFPFMFISAQEPHRQPKPALPRIRALLPARSETIDAEIEVVDE